MLYSAGMVTFPADVSVDAEAESAAWYAPADPLHYQRIWEVTLSLQLSSGLRASCSKLCPHWTCPVSHINLKENVPGNLLLPCRMMGVCPSSFARSNEEGDCVS